MRIISYVGNFEGAVDTPVITVFSLEGHSYPKSGVMRKPCFADTDVTYFLQERDGSDELLIPIDEEATVYSESREMIGVVIVESVKSSVRRHAG
ncbi:MAG TPA: hypothetical protein VJI12_00255 [archaeon]|nr:hypothetical protein [archaeon]